MPILLAFLAIPLLEIVLFVQLVARFGVLGTLLEIFASGALGVFLMRLEPYRNAPTSARRWRKTAARPARWRIPPCA